ncbi:ATP-binding protein [Amycolatopsis sp. NPDC004378]
MNFDEELTQLTRRVAATADTTVELSGHPDLRQVRKAVVDALMFGARPTDRFGPVLLVIDELVGNAYLHTTAARELHVTRAAKNLLIEVSDRDPDVAAVRELRPGSGRYGLRLVGQLSLDWGVRADRDGKVVWALVPVEVYPAEP